MKSNIKPLARAIIRTLAEVPDKQLDKAVAEVVHFLREQGLLSRSRELLRACDATWAEEFGASKVTVTSAYRLPAELKKHLEEKAGSAEFHTVIDPRLLGGAIVRVDDRLIDGSALGALQTLEASLEKSI